MVDPPRSGPRLLLPVSRPVSPEIQSDFRGCTGMPPDPGMASAPSVAAPWTTAMPGARQRLASAVVRSLVSLEYRLFRASSVGDWPETQVACGSGLGERGASSPVAGVGGFGTLAALPTEKAADEPRRRLPVTPFSLARSRREASNSERLIRLLPTETAIACPC